MATTRNNWVFKILSMLAATLAGVGSANATVWNVNIGQGTEPGGANEITTADNFVGAAIENTANSYWNPLTEAQTGLALRDSTNASTGVTLDWDGTFFSQQGQPNAEIFTSYGGWSQNVTMTLNNLTPGSTYDLVLYSYWGWGAGSRPITQTLGSGLSGTFFINSATTPGLVQDPDPADVAGSYNYTRLSGLSPDGNNRIALSLPTVNSPINGFQLVENAVVPEPTSICLAGIGLALLAWRMRK